MARLSRLPALLAFLAVAACGAASDQDVVARAGDLTLSPEEAAAIVAPHSALPADSATMDAVANLWVDYALLAQAGMADSTMAQVDVTPVVNYMAADQLILALRDSAITVPPIGDAELRQQYRDQRDRSRVRARQILLTWPEGASQAQKDSVRRTMDEIRSRLADGADFAALARQYSQDPGTAGRGGELGVVRRGQLVAPLDSVLFSLKPGELSPAVSSPYGLHLLQVEERVVPSLDEFRADVMHRRTTAAESVFVASLTANANIEVADDAAERVRALARHPRASLSDSEKRRPLLWYDGGTVTQEDVLWYLQNQSPQFRAQIAQSHGDDVPGKVLQAVQNRALLIAEGLRRGWAVPAAPRQNLQQALHRNLVEAARQLGLQPITAAAGQSPDEAANAAVLNLLSGIFSGQKREVTPLGVMSYVLRRQYPTTISGAGLKRAAERVRALRASDGPSAGGASAPQP